MVDSKDTKYELYPPPTSPSSSSNKLPSPTGFQSLLDHAIANNPTWPFFPCVRIILSRRQTVAGYDETFPPTELLNYTLRILEPMQRLGVCGVGISGSAGECWVCGWGHCGWWLSVGGSVVVYRVCIVVWGCLDECDQEYESRGAVSRIRVDRL